MAFIMTPAKKTKLKKAKARPSSGGKKALKKAAEKAPKKPADRKAKPRRRPARKPAAPGRAPATKRKADSPTFKKTAPKPKKKADRHKAADPKKPGKKPQKKLSSKKPALKPPRRSASVTVKDSKKQREKTAEGAGGLPKVGLPKVGPPPAGSKPAPQRFAGLRADRPAKEPGTEKAEEITAASAQKELQKATEREFVLKDMEGRDYCLFEDCGSIAVSGEYCRLHYIGRHDYIKARENILKTGWIQKKTEEIAKKSAPFSLLAAACLIEDLRSKKSFAARIKPLLEDWDFSEEENYDEDSGLSVGGSASGRALSGGPEGGGGG